MSTETVNGTLPNDASTPRWIAKLAAADPITVATWLLRIAVVIHAATVFLMVFTERQTQFNNLFFLHLFHHHELPDYTGLAIADQYFAARFVERVTVSIFLFAAVWLLIKPHGMALLYITIYVFLEAFAGYYMTGYQFSEWTIPAHALRYGTPLALLLLIVFPHLKNSGPWRIATSALILRIATATVFFAHGMYCIMEHPGFADLIIGTTRNLFGISIAEATALTAMKVIGIVDIILALALILLPHPAFLPKRLFPPLPANNPIRRRIMPAILIWCAFWGLITAISRITAIGFKEGRSEYFEILIRASHVLAPLALLYLFITQWRADDAKTHQTE